MPGDSSPFGCVESAPTNWCPADSRLSPPGDRGRMSVSRCSGHRTVKRIPRLYGALASVRTRATTCPARQPGAELTHARQSEADLDRDVIDARVWSGIHFRSADVVGSA